jgi:hypothetical protein
MKDFRDLIVWDKSHKPTLEIYGITAKFPRFKLQGLKSQIRRCSASVGANIAERRDQRANWTTCCCRETWALFQTQTTANLRET